jgi:hypothetical protein
MCPCLRDLACSVSEAASAFPLTPLAQSGSKRTVYTAVSRARPRRRLFHETKLYLER